MFKFWSLNLILIIICLLASFFVASAKTHEVKNKLWNATWIDLLKHDLLDDYDRYVKPSETKTPTNVTLNLVIKHIEINEENGLFTVWGWLSFSWFDNKLKWNPSNYANLSVFAASKHEIWQPDIVLYNSATVDGVEGYGNSLLLVYSNSQVLWVPQIKLNAFCSLNLRLWPFDTQECSLIFGSWVYSGVEIDINLKNNSDTVVPGFNIERFTENHQWIITNISVGRRSILYQCCEENYVSAIYNLTLERRSPMYKAIVVTPATVTSLMILSVFWLPPTAGEKIILNGFVFINLIIFLIYFAIKLPVFAFSIPLIVIFYSASLVLLGFSMIISVAVLYLSKTKHERKIPIIIGNLLRGNIGRFLCVSIIERKHDQTEMHDTTSKSFDDNFLMISHSVQYDWILFATAIDRIAFMLYVLILFILGGSCCMF